MFSDCLIYQPYFFLEQSSCSNLSGESGKTQCCAGNLRSSPDPSVDLPPLSSKGKAGISVKESEDQHTVRLLEIESARLDVEKEHLDVEKQRLEIERQRLLIEQQKHQLYLMQMNMNLSQMGIQVEEADMPTTSTANIDKFASYKV